MTFSDQIFFLHLSDCRKQDGADPRISAPIEPQLLQPELTHSTSPLHKVGRGDPWALSLNRDPLTLSVWPPLSVILCYYQSLHILSRVLLSDVLFSPAFFCITCVIKAHKALWLQLLCLTDSIYKGLFLAGNSQPHADKFSLQAERAWFHQNPQVTAHNRTCLFFISKDIVTHNIISHVRLK